MKLNKTLLLAAGLVAAGAALSLSGAFASKGVPSAPATLEPQDLPAGSVRVLEIQPFQLGESLTHFHRAEAPAFDSGWLVALEAPRELLVPRQVAEPVLYVGAETAQRVNVGQDSGRLVAIVPNTSSAGADLDILSAPVFFGDAELPERVTRESARAQLDAALAAGATVEADRAERLLDPIELPDGYELHYFASTWVERHSPQEIDLIRGLQAPRIR